jgi:hypothetical protein
MRILVVAMADSIHTARWLNQVADQGWDIHLFPSTDTMGDVHPELDRRVVSHSGYLHWKSGIRKNDPAWGNAISRGAEWAARKILPRVRSDQRTAYLARLVDRLRPDVVHSMEIQRAGYLTLEVRKRAGRRFPPWIVTNWGSDIYLFGRLSEHEHRIREVLRECDYYSCECQRDVALAKMFGLRGKVLPVFPNSGGFDLEEAVRLRSPGPVSRRRKILLKGYQHWAGRALVGLRALERCADSLAGFEVCIHSATDDVVVAAGLFQRATGIPAMVLPKGTSHQEILSRHGRARISIGLSIGDAISTSLLEAMVMGSFPIQSWTSCADEWIEDGRTGLLVPPDDPEAVEAAIRKALTDDGLVDRAEEENLRVAALRLDREQIRPLAVGIYNQVAAMTGRRR